MFSNSNIFQQRFTVVQIVAILSVLLYLNYKLYALTFISAGNPLDGCYHIFLDVGSNVGIQVRKLYEPHLYPDAEFVHQFSKYFGTESHKDGQVCVVGFEANPEHTERLVQLQAAYTKCGFRVHFYTATAAWYKNGTADFFTNLNEPNKLGGTLIQGAYGVVYNNSNKQMTRLFDLANFVNEVVVKRLVPDLPAAQSPTILLKVDIEGSELELLIDLLLRGSLQHIEAGFVEYHPHIFPASNKRHNHIAQLKSSLETLQQIRHSYMPELPGFNVQYFEEESYFNSNFPLPQCT